MPTAKLGSEEALGRSRMTWFKLACSRGGKVLAGELVVGSEGRFRGKSDLCYPSSQGTSNTGQNGCRFLECPTTPHWHVPVQSDVSLPAPGQQSSTSNFDRVTCNYVIWRFGPAQPWHLSSHTPPSPGAKCTGVQC